MFKKILFIFLLFSALISCNKKSVELPLIPVTGKTNISNHSQIWVFINYDENKIKANVNKKNIISSTNWIINMDKRLPMNEVIPVLEMIKAQRDRKSPHSSDEMKTYLSYSNTKDKNISLYPVDSLHFLVLDKVGYDDLLSHYKSDTNIYLFEKSFNLNDETFQYHFFNEDFLRKLPNKPIHFFLDGNMSYQVYLEKRLLLNKFISDVIPIDKTEYMLNN